MDETIQLRCHNAELETELRLIKTQLAQAHGTIVRLATCFSDQRVRSQIEELAQSHSSLNQGRIDNIQSNTPTCVTNQADPAQHEATPGASTNLYEAQTPFKRLHMNGELTPPDSDRVYTESTKVEEINLLDLDDEGDLRVKEHCSSPYPQQCSPLATTFTSRAKGNDANINAVSCPKEDAGMIDIFNVDEQLERTNTASKHGNKRSLQRDGDLLPSPTSSDNTFTVIPAPFAEDYAPTHIPPPEGFDRRPMRFADYEHNRLLGSAAFIEDMDDEQKTEHWTELAGRNGRHSAADWRFYYEEVVLPKYLEKIGATCGPVREERKCNVEEEASLNRQEIEDVACEVANQGRDSDSSAWTSEAYIRIDLLPTPRSTLPELWPLEMGPGIQPRQQDDETLGISQHGTSLDNGVLVDDQCRDENTQSACPSQTNSIISGEAVAGNASEGDGSSAKSRNPVAIGPLQIMANAVPATAGNSSSTESTASKGATSAFNKAEMQYHNVPTYLDKVCNARSATNNDYRTVVISNIPANITFVKVLDKVRCGKIISASFLATANMKTIPAFKGNTVIVTFVSSKQAKAFVEYCARNTITFHLADSLAQISLQVTLLQTACRPLERDFIHAVHRGSLSRVCFIHDNHCFEANEVVREIMDFGGQHLKICRRPLRTYRDAESGILVLEYAKIEHAVNAIGVVQDDWRFFDGVSNGFLPDPCARPLETAIAQNLSEEKHVDHKIVERNMECHGKVVKLQERDPLQEQLQHSLADDDEVELGEI